jgi:hypothetical protein
MNFKFRGGEYDVKEILDEMQITREKDAQLAVLLREPVGFDIDTDGPWELEVDVTDDLLGDNENEGPDEPPFADAVKVTGKEVEARVGQAEEIKGAERKEEIAKIEEIGRCEGSEETGNRKRKALGNMRD